MCIFTWYIVQYQRYITVTSHERNVTIACNTTVCSRASPCQQQWKHLCSVTGSVLRKSTDISPRQGPIMWKAFPCHNVVMNLDILTPPTAQYNASIHALQICNFRIGMTWGIECDLWSISPKVYEFIIKIFWKFSLIQSWFWGLDEVWIRP